MIMLLLAVIGLFLVPRGSRVAERINILFSILFPRQNAVLNSKD